LGRSWLFPRKPIPNQAYHLRRKVETVRSRVLSLLYDPQCARTETIAISCHSHPTANGGISTVSSGISTRSIFSTRSILGYKGAAEEESAVVRELCMTESIGRLMGITFVGIIGASQGSVASSAEYTLMPSPQTVNIGNFNAANRPVLTINSGDIVTLEAATQLDPETIDASGVVPRSAVPQYVRDIYREVKDRGPNTHVLTGPIFVTGAMPGDVLEVRILDVSLPSDYGYNAISLNRSALPGEFSTPWTRVIPLDRANKTAEVARGVMVPIDHPFFGTMGVAPPAAMGRIGSGPPGIHTGNLDNKDLGSGSILYMPVHAAGALFSAGDGHAVQGYGEVDITAIETNLRGRFQFVVRKDMKLTWPRAETPTHWIAMGLDEDLDEAMKIAVRETIAFITGRFPMLTREEAYMIASVAVDYHVTQVVDGTKGVHAMIPKAIFVNR
jgi:acetamidase/formamidase